MKQALANYSTSELLAEVQRRTMITCPCGQLRQEITQTQEGFKPRTGCLSCNRWDGPVLCDK